MAIDGDPYRGENRYALDGVASKAATITPGVTALTTAFKCFRVFNTGTGNASFRMRAVGSEADVTITVGPGAELFPVRPEFIYAATPTPTGLEFTGFGD